MIINDKALGCNQTHSSIGDNVGRDKHEYHNYYGEHQVPKQLTSTLSKSIIIGRKKELQEIDNLLNTSESILLINGIGGVGKSTIASHYLHSKKELYDYYGFFEGLESFVNELKEPLNLKSEKFQNAFMEALSRLRTLKGNKLLVLDDIKDIEENEDDITKILSLKDSGYKILITSRQRISYVKEYSLHTLFPEDAKKLFLEYHQTKELKKVNIIVGYLDYHALFVELVAKTIESEGYELDEIIKKFEQGDLSTIEFINNKDNDTSFNQNLQELFDMQEKSLKKEYILLLKQLSTLPSIDIQYSFLEKILDKKRLQGRLNFLVKKGWLTKFEKSYKLHQIIKEYILNNHTPNFKEIEIILDSLNRLLKNSTDAQVAVDNRNNIISFESFVNILNILELKNEKVGNFFAHLGNIYRHLGLYEKSEQFCLKAVKINEKILGLEHQYTATSYNNLALLYKSIGEYQKAKELYIKALTIREKILEKEHPDIVTSYNNLALLYWLKGEYKKSEPLYLKALEISEKILGGEHPHTATSYNNLALLYKSTGEYPKAERYYLKALKIREKILVEEHPDRATSYNNLATLFFLKKEYKKAEPYYLKALKIREKVLGEEHPDTATSYNNLAELYRSMGEYKKVESLYLKDLKISEKILGINHPDTASTYNNLASLYQSMEEYEKAEKLYLKALDINEKVLGEEHPDTASFYNNLAGLYESIAKYKKAEFFYLKALNIKEKILGNNHPDTAISYNSLAVFYYGQGDYKKAYIYMKVTVEVRSKVFSETDLDLINSKKDLEIIEEKIDALEI